MYMTYVRSRAITAIGYDPQTKRLRIKFKQGSIYNFCNVPEHVFNGLMNAASKGTFYNDHIRDLYPC